eukprot:CAMPEP_0119406290 /NCGR_PEP_ID=MMETSP1335-20130426/679_1 /TAXON_ID=259385 /ORGANISM="Chrysoculter rhomboideus, Strain RCC1486" /LENGTH=147 /DNA_ID=CAMNT_0007430363 /DNA_START=306 /DNA_END=749 /DNA_ORIENTATION=-
MKSSNTQLDLELRFADAKRRVAYDAQLCKLNSRVLSRRARALVHTAEHLDLSFDARVQIAGIHLAAQAGHLGNVLFEAACTFHAEQLSIALATDAARGVREDVRVRAAARIEEREASVWDALHRAQEEGDGRHGCLTDGSRLRHLLP